MNNTRNSKSVTTIEQMAKQLLHLNVENVNSNVLQQFTLYSPYMIILETSSQKSQSYYTYQVTPAGTASVQYDQLQHQHLINRPQHKHDFIEIMYVLYGSVTNRIENQLFTYTEGQCCIMNRNICHCEVFEGDYQAVFFMFQNEFLQTILEEYQQELQLTSDLLKKQPVFQLITDAVSSTHQFDKIYLDLLPVIPTNEILNQLIPLFNDVMFETIEKRAGYSLYIKGTFTRIFHLLNNTSLYSVDQVHSKAKQHEYLVTKIIHMLEANHGRCSREQLSEQLHYTGEYLNRIFKKYTGKTISEYRQHIILKEGKKLLLDTDMNISDMISELGFSNRSYFYRIFEEAYGMTPLEYRQQYKAH